MATSNDVQKKLLGEDPGVVAQVEGAAKRDAKVTAAGGCGVCCLAIFVLVWIVQGFLYFIATTAWGCREGALENYNYINNGAEASAAHDQAYNVFPQNSYLVEQAKTFYGQSFLVQPIGSGAGDSGQGGLASAGVGKWWLAWGPVFNTYVYQDVVDSQTLLYMRRNLLRLGQSHRVGRCDGKGPYIEFEEGNNFWMNKIKHITGQTQAVSLKVFVDNGQGREWLATLEEQNQGVPGITLMTKLNKTDETDARVADSVLHNYKQVFHPVMGAPSDMQEWYVQNKKENPLPYYLLSAVTLLYGFNIKGTVQRGGNAVEMAQQFVQNTTAVFERPPQLQTHV